MKKTGMAALLLIAATACNNNNDANTAVDNDTTVKTTPTVENVNGNLPDSTNTIDVGTNDGSVNQ